MNAHIPQSITSANELMELASVSKHIISARESKPLVGIVQDVALGVYRITKSGVRINQKQLFNLLASNIRFAGDAPEAAFKNGHKLKWTGRQLMSTIIPSSVNLEANNSSHDDKNGKDTENHVVIKNGEHLQGIIDKKIYQMRTAGLVHSIFNDCGPDETRIFFDNTQKLVCDWLVHSGFSVGLSDLIVDQKATESIKSKVHDMKVKVYDVIRNIHMGTYKNESMSDNNEHFESEVKNILNNIISELGKEALGNINDLSNRMINMVKAGSKGSIINVSQMIACLGQQNVDGKRVPYGFDDRTLPHYTKYDDGPESRGFVENSFISGLSPQEFFFHAMGGREGLIDTAVKSVTGDTTIIIIEDNIPKYVKIGEWIDRHLDGPEKDNVEHSPEDRNLELLNLKSKVYIPTVDDDGKSSWGELTAVTRHDPGERIYKVTTLGGRSVTVAESESLLIWNEETKQFKKMYTPDVKVGDYVPTTAFLPEPPVIVDHVDMSIYFPKDKYVHGTEYNKAVKMMKEAQGNNFFIPRGWWEKNNGVNFTTPYPSKALLHRATVRSNTENIHDGCVYPFRARRETARIPDRFELNYENGQFIGIFLADGNTDTDPAGSVQISKEDKSVQDFVRSYFDKMNITHRTVAQQKERGISYGVIASSTLLARFLDAFVGAGARNKYVPDVAFVAPLEFVKGILSGYFGGDGTINRGSISACSSSPRLMEGISMLCSRIGVFGKQSITQQTKTNLDMDVGDIAPMNNISIRAQWGQQFAGEIDLLMDSKNLKMQENRYADSHQNFKQFNDMVMDAIVDITVMGVEDHPKLYDVTVPSTLNFVIANGLGMQDTSETGYLQRKLVKAMEDCKINYDYTVRNASGSIVQFLYGEDGMDGSKIESQPLRYIDMDYAKLVKEYHLTSTDIPMSASDEARMDAHFRQVLEDREFLIKEIFESKDGKDIMYPVSFMRLVNNTMAMYAKYDRGVNIDNLTPTYVLDTIEKLGEELIINKNNKGNKFMQILLRCYLSPKKVLLDYKFTKMAFDHVIQQVRLKFYDAIAHPSEMVGVLAAQSIGEPATQLTLNSVEWNTEVLLKAENKLQRVKIGQFIDSQIAGINQSDLENHPNDTTLGWIKDQNYSILSCDENGQVNWKLIEAVTKHPPINEDGSNTLLKVTTKSGREVIATKAKSFLKRVDNKIVPVRGDDLGVGDYLPVSTIAHLENMDYNRWVISEEDDWIPDVITKEHGKINIPRARLQKIMEESRCLGDVEVYMNVLHENIKYDEIVSIEEVVSDHPYVYDFTVKDTRNFNIYNGLCIRDTFHLSGVSSASKSVRGVPRLKELLSATKNIKAPSMMVFMPNNVGTDKLKCKEVLNSLETSYLKDIVISTKIYYDPNDFNSTIEEDAQFLATYSEFMEVGSLKVENLSPWLLRMEFDKEKMLEHQISMIDVYHVLHDYYSDDISAMFSDDNAKKLVFRIKLEATGDSDDMITNLKALEKNILENVIIKGIKGVNKVSMSKKEYPKYNPDTMQFDKAFEWVLETNGTNFQDILCRKTVDYTRTISNNVNDIYEFLGIEAARQALLNEISDVIISAGPYVNYRHLALLVDTMTNKGYLLSIDRHGINRVDIGPLAKCSFEETTDMLIKAGIFSEIDRINGVSANIMLGQIPPCGTGDTDVIMDEWMIQNHGDSHSAKEKEGDGDKEDGGEGVEACLIDNLTFDFTLPSIDENIVRKNIKIRVV